jgi:Spy/CpxP family protein refolding chaperone
MKTEVAITLFFVFLFVLPLSPGWAQKMEDPQLFWLPEDLRLTNKQVQQMTSIQRRYLTDIRFLRNDLLNKRYNLQRLLSDPKAKSSEIRARQKEMFVLESQIEEKLLEYQLKVRDILTPDQFRLWVSRNHRRHGSGMHHDRGMGSKDHKRGMGFRHE